MAQIEKLLISASTEEAFLQSLAAQEIPDYAIVFIEDTKKLYVKGVYYPCPYTKEELNAKFEECNENIETIINSLKGSNNGLASLDSTGKVPASQLPSYVDDVLEYNNRSGFPGTGESGKIYIAKDTNLTYRWSGSAYVEISQSLALGETSSTAYPGNKGKQNADNIASLQTKTTNIDNYTVNGKKISTNPTISKADVGLGNVNNTSDANKPISTATQSALNQKQNTLVSGTNIKTLNGQSLLGSGNITIQEGITVATSEDIGGIKIGYVENGKNYPVELDGGNKAYVNVPWTDTNTTYNNATTSTAGLMSAADKTKLDGIATGANKYVHPTTSGNKHIPAGGSSGQILRWASDGTAQWGNDNNTTYSVATSSSNGLMSSTDKTKLDGIASGANKTTVDSTLSSSSTNPVQNKVINSALSGKANTTHTHTASQVTGLASVATSGSYNDLSNKPAIPSAYTLPAATTSRLGGVKVGTGLSVAGDGTLSVSSGGVADLSGTLVDGIVISSGANLNNYTTSGYYYKADGGSVTNAPISSLAYGFSLLVLNSTSNIICQIFTGSAESGNTESSFRMYVRYYMRGTWSSWSKLIRASDLSTVATSGNYNDLSGKPSIPSAYTLPTATASTLGGVKSSTTGTVSGKDYRVQVNSDGTMKVNVPWINTTYTLATTSSQGLLKTLSGEQREVLTGDGNWATMSQYCTIESADTSVSSQATLTLDTSVRDSTSLLILDTETEINIPSNRRIRIRKGETSSYYVSLPIEQGYTFYPGIYYLMIIYNDRLYPINIHFSNTYSSNTWTAYQDFSAGAGNSGSDMRFKSEVSNVSNTLEAINKLNVIKYIWEHPDEKKVYNTFGVNADQLLDLGGIYATMVHTRPDQYNTKWVEYDRFGVLAIKGLQELNKKLEDKCAKYEKIISVLADKCGVNIDEL